MAEIHHRNTVGEMLDDGKIVADEEVGQAELALVLQQQVENLRLQWRLAVMLRIYCLQQWYSLSNPGAEDTLYDICSMRTFAGLELGRDTIPDETTILNFRHLLECQELTKAVFAAVAEFLVARGALLHGGTIIDATLSAA